MRLSQNKELKLRNSRSCRSSTLSFLKWSPSPLNSTFFDKSPHDVKKNWRRANLLVHPRKCFIFSRFFLSILRTNKLSRFAHSNGSPMSKSMLSLFCWWRKKDEEDLSSRLSSGRECLLFVSQIQPPKWVFFLLVRKVENSNLSNLNFPQLRISLRVKREMHGSSTRVFSSCIFNFLFFHF